MSGRQTLTWQSVSAPDFEASSRMMERASKNFNDAAERFGKASDSIGEEHKFVQNENAVKLDALIQNTPPEEREALYEQMRNAVTTGSGEFGTQKTGALINAQDSFNKAQTLRDNNDLAAKRAEDANNTLLWNQINQLNAEGKYAEAAVLLGQFKDQATAQSKYLTALQSSLTMAAGIQQQQGSLDTAMKSSVDNNRTSNVGDVVEAAKNILDTTVDASNTYAKEALDYLEGRKDVKLSDAENKELHTLVDKFMKSGDMKIKDFMEQIDSFLAKVQGTPTGTSVNDSLARTTPSAFVSTPQTGSNNTGVVDTGDIGDTQKKVTEESWAGAGTKISTNDEPSKEAENLSEQSGEVINKNIPENLRLPDNVVASIFDKNGNVDESEYKIVRAIELGAPKEEVTTEEKATKWLRNKTEETVKDNTKKLNDMFRSIPSDDNNKFHMLVSAWGSVDRKAVEERYATFTPVSVNTLKYEKSLRTAVLTGEGLKAAKKNVIGSWEDPNSKLSDDEKAAMKARYKELLPKLDDKYSDAGEITRHAQQQLDAYQMLGAQLQQQDAENNLTPANKAVWNGYLKLHKENNLILDSYIKAKQDNENGKNQDYINDFETKLLVSIANELYKNSEDYAKGKEVTRIKQAENILRDNEIDPENVIKGITSYGENIQKGVDNANTNEGKNREVAAVQDVFPISDDAAKGVVGGDVEYKYLMENGRNDDLQNSERYKKNWGVYPLANFNDACVKMNIDPEDALSMGLLQGLKFNDEKSVDAAVKMVKENPTDFMRNTYAQTSGNLTNILTNIKNQTKKNNALSAELNFFKTLSNDSEAAREEKKKTQTEQETQTKSVTTSPIPGVSTEFFDDYNKNMAHIESGNKLETDTGNGAVGKHQFRSAALIDAGLMDSAKVKAAREKGVPDEEILRNPENWIGDMSLGKFLKDENLQDTVFEGFTKQNYGYLKKKGVITDSTPPDEVMALLYAAHFSGHGKIKPWYDAKKRLDKLKKDKNATSIEIAAAEEAFKNANFTQHNMSIEKRYNAGLKIGAKHKPANIDDFKVAKK